MSEQITQNNLTRRVIILKISKINNDISITAKKIIQPSKEQCLLLRHN